MIQIAHSGEEMRAKWRKEMEEDVTICRPRHEFECNRQSIDLQKQDGRGREGGDGVGRRWKQF